ncbi:hypothetical protein EPR50_G00083620 [Perca flavescens]|uniref:Uncharacterized protein n=1 Tax=Perca flavescens TaxID=8167 RepID=A0A484D1U3_PERFV|nr:hypothetical protein EPR50_G00083620 [Perca flavescens]
MPFRTFKCSCAGMQLMDFCALTRRLCRCLPISIKSHEAMADGDSFALACAEKYNQRANGPVEPPPLPTRETGTVNI